MRRELGAVLCTAVLLLAGCQGFTTADGTATPNGTDTPDEVVQITVSDTSTDNGSVTFDDSGPPEDPERDRLGWEGGYWHNESLDVNESDGLNASEQAALVNRSMARVEYIRDLEFEESVPVEVISRDEYTAGSGGSNGDALREFDNGKFEALFLTGESEDSIETQESNLGASVLGYYSPSEDSIVIVSDSEQPTISEGTLGHELVHALQDQQFDLNTTAQTRDGVQGHNGLVEGDASAVDTEYTDRCGDEWECLIPETSGGGGGGGDRHAGISFLFYFPYSDGIDFVADLRDRDGWDAVDAAYDDVPDGAREVITPSDYPDWEPRNVTIDQEPDDNWEQIRPSQDRARPDYGTVGPSGIASAMAYTRTDTYNTSSVVTAPEVVNYGSDGTISGTDPYNYDLAATSGWEGGRMEVYTNGTDGAYVWRTEWSDADDAETFAEAWGDVVDHWGGTRTSDGVWVIEADSPFTDAVAIHVDGDTVTVVNAPTEAQLSELYDA